MRIAEKELKYPLVLAPMAGISDYAFRRVARELGIELAYTEMISAKGLCYENERTKEYLKTDENDQPLVLQLFGRDPEAFKVALDQVCQDNFVAIDVNMGCPAGKILRNNEGSALMKEPEQAVKIIQTLREHSHLPVSAKIRLGLDSQSKNALDFALALEDAGISFLGVHGRTTAQLYRGVADWQAISEIATAIQIPVLGSGDLFTADDVLRALQFPGIAGVYLARGVRGRPWLIRECVSKLEGKNVQTPLHKKKEIFHRHLEYLIEDKGEYRAMQEMRSQLSEYLRGMGLAGAQRAKAMHMTSKDSLYELIDWHG